MNSYPHRYQADDDVPHRPHPQDDALMSPQARRYWREQHKIEQQLIKSR